MASTLAVRGFVVGACLLTFFGSACTPSDPPPATPSPSTSTPTETAQEREEREAYAAAETSYREFRAEVERVYARGGAANPTALMRTTAGGQYLASYQEVSEAYRSLKHHSKGSLVIDYVRPNGFSESELILDVCEDGRNVATYDSKGKKLYNDDVRKIRLTARLVGKTWKIWTGQGEKASSCD